MDEAPYTGDLDLAAVSTVDELAALLRVVHLRADKPSLRTLAAKTRHDATPLSKTAVSDMLKGMRLPRKAVMVAFLRTCGIGDDRIEAWRLAWDRIAGGEPVGHETRGYDRRDRPAMPEANDEVGAWTDAVSPPIPLAASSKILASPEILARGEELGRVLNALNNSSDASSWLVISPPGFGKSWLLGQLETRAAQPESGGWVTKMVDLRIAGPTEPEETVGNGQHDAMTVISSLFSVDPPQPSETDDDCVRRAAQNIIRGGQSRLCLLDSAELLPADTVKQLRKYLGTIYRRVQDSGREDAHLAFVVASRRDEGWRGIMPPPEPSVLQLGGFGPSVLQDALEGLARDIPVVRSPAELRKDAELVHHVTDGMPGPVLESLQWIRAEQWLDVERLEDSEFFDKKIAQYVERRLLARDSLLPAADGQSTKPAKQLAALREGIRVLVPYRFITLSHVSHHVDNDLDNDRPLRDALKEADWQAGDLWQAIAGTALLLPLDDPWREIHPAVRRLLFRYFYRPDERADAHARAAGFAKDWAGLVKR